MKRTFKPLLLVALVAAAVPLTFAGDPQGPGPQATPQASTQPQPVYGRGLLTLEERAAFHAQMLNAKTPEERNTLWLEHQKLIRERAQTLRVQAPVRPPRIGPVAGGLQGTCLRGGPGPRHGYGYGYGWGM
jgi:hypothetical protein